MHKPDDVSDAGSPAALHFENFELTQHPPALTQMGQTVSLPSQPLKLLMLLAKNHGVLVSHAEISAHLWPSTTVDFSRSIHVYIRQIRSALGDDAASPRLIENVLRQGYRFIACVKTSQSPDPAEPIVEEHFRRYRASIAAGFAFAALLVSIFIVVQIMTPRPAGVDTAATLAAADLYQRGLYLLEQRERSPVTKSLQYFEDALDIDPTFAAAHAGAARAYFRLSDHDAARARARRALALDDGLAEAHMVLGVVELTHGWDWGEAHSRFLAALKLNPDSAKAHHGIATVFILTGDFKQGIAYMQRAREIDPVSTLIRADLGWFYYIAGDYWKAAKACNEAVDLAPNEITNRHCLIRSLSLAGAAQLAAAHVEPYMQMSNATETEIEMVLSQPNGEILPAFDRWRLQNYESRVGDSMPSSAELAFAAAVAGNVDQALDYIDLAIKERNSLIPFIAVDPGYRQLNSDPRFQKLLSEVNLT